jgi:acetyl-CoA carboxylase carboxyltransferase component
MGVLETTVDPRAQSYLDVRTATLSSLAELETGLDAAREGGGEREVTRHHARGKLLARERVELLVDRDSPLLELSPVAGWGTGGPVGAAVVTAVGMVADRPCVIMASDPTVRGGAVGTGTLQKVQRAQQIAQQNRLPLIGLLEANGTEPADQPGILGHAGEVVAGFARLASARIPTAAACFGGSTWLAGVDLADSFDYLVGIRPAGGTGTTWGTGMTGGTGGTGAAGGNSRPVDHLAEDERDALRLTRRCVQRLCPGPSLGSADLDGGHPPPYPDGPDGGPAAVQLPRHDPEDLLAIPVTEPREILARVVDGSELDEDQPGYGPAVCAGWARVHGHPVAVLANAGPVSGAEEVGKVIRFVQRAESAGTPLLLLRHGTGLPSPAETALAGAAVPLLTLRVGPWQGVSAVAARARFRFAWPGAGVTPAGSPGEGHPGPAAESALRRSGRLDDDGVIDPRDTRTVLGFCLWLVQRCRS